MNRSQPRLLNEAIARAECVKGSRRIGYEILAPFITQPNQIRKHQQRKGLAKIRYGINVALVEQPVNKALRLLEPGRHYRFQACERGHLVHQVTGTIMQWWVNLEQQRWRPPRLFQLEIGQAHAAPRYEGLPIAQCRAHLVIACHGITADGIQANNRASITQLVVIRIGIDQEGLVERIQ